THIRLSRNIAEALDLWEWYRSGDLSGKRRDLDLAFLLPHIKSEVVLSYVLSPVGGLNVLTVSDGAVECQRLSVRMEQLDPVAARFLRECADPKSPVGALQRDARQLYDWLIAPVAHRLRPGQVHIIEPDGPIGAIPLQALTDPAGSYLGERFALVVS